MIGDNFNLSGLLEEDIFGELKSMGSKRTFDRNETLFKRGDVADYLYIVISGSIKISTYSYDGKEIILNTLQKNDLCGEISLLDDSLRSADAIVQKKSELQKISKSDFLGFLENTPNTYKAITKMLCHRIHYISENVEQLFFLSVRKRIAKKISLLVKYGESFELSISQVELAKMINASRETVNLILKEFCALGLIEISRKKISIKQLEELQRIAEEGER